MRLMFVAFLLYNASAQTVQSMCTDGSAVGSNQCCQDTDLCPPYCLGRMYTDTCNGDKSTCRTCQCYGCCDDRVTIDASCSYDNCENYLISMGQTMKARTMSGDCTKCMSETSICTLDTDSLEACASSFPPVDVVDGFLKCYPPPPPDSSATVSVTKSPPPPSAPISPLPSPPSSSPSPPPAEADGDSATTEGDGTATVMKMGFTVAGDVSDFTTEVLASMEASIATKLNVNKEAVTVSAAAGSVKLTVDVT